MTDRVEEMRRRVHHGNTIVAASTFNELLHPRGHDGKFIEKLGFVRWLSGGGWKRGQVSGIDEKGTITVHGDDRRKYTFKHSRAKELYSLPKPKGFMDKPSALTPQPSADPSAHVPFKDRLGRCYELAGRFASVNSGSTLVHGSIQGFDNPRIGHAWVIDVNGEIFEPTSGQHYDPYVFEALFNPVERIRYSSSDLNTELVRSETWGPWDEAAEPERAEIFAHENRAEVLRRAVHGTSAEYISRKAHDVMDRDMDVVIPHGDIPRLAYEFARSDHVIDLTHVTVPGTNGMFSQMRNSGIPRALMPQIPEENLGDFKQALLDAGHPYEVRRVFPSSLIPTQAELEGRASGQIAEAIVAGKIDLEANPLWVSRDGHILDGHHRWAGATIVEAEEAIQLSIPVVQVDLDIADLLEFARDFNTSLGIESLPFGEFRPGTVITAAGIVEGVKPRVSDDGIGMATDAADFAALGIDVNDLDDDRLDNGATGSVAPAYMERVEGNPSM